MINGLTIRPEVFVSDYRNCFVATIKFMLGDADSYPTGEIELQNDQQVIALRNMYESAKFHGREDGYRPDPLYKAFADLLEYGDEDDALYDLFQDDQDAWGAGRFEEFSVLWYDEQGNPHAVDFLREN